MTRVDFYLLPDVDAAAKLRFACRLAHKAATSGKRVHVRTVDSDQAIELDAVMWAYPAELFLPHDIAQDGTTSTAPVLIGHTEPDPADDEVLINLGTQIPDYFGRFERVAEIVLGPEREDGRERYKYYRDRGYPLFHHDLDNWEEQ